MPAPQDNATAVLEIMREWEWQRCNPDGEQFHPGMMLSQLISRLVMEGAVKPQDTVLELLSQGKLLARGDYQWRKYDGDRHYQLEGVAAPIKQRHWQILAELSAAELTRQFSDVWQEQFVTLDNLGLGQCSEYEWQPLENSFSTASLIEDPLWTGAMDQEEWYSVREIEVWPLFAEQNEIGDSLEPAAPINRGGRPPAADWEAAALEMAGRYYRGDLKPATIADVVRALADWLAERGIHPSDSVLRTHAKPIFDAFRQWEQG